jgi:putative serine protease PepD
VTNVASGTLSVGQIAKKAVSVVEIDATESNSSSPFPGAQGSSALGTGFVYDSKGNIVTNQHVVDGATSVTVKFPDGSTYKGTVVGTDASTDLAVVHVNAPASKLVPLTLADSSNDGVGFAIPSNTVRSIVTQLIANGKAQHALLGVTVKTAANGVAIGSVSSGSAADSAGLKAGDVITAVDGTEVATAEKLRAIIAGHKPGDTITLTVLSNGSTKTVTATLGSKT